MKRKSPVTSKSAKRQQALGVSTRVLRLRVKDKHAAFLLAQAREVNLVWNYCQEVRAVEAVVNEGSQEPGAGLGPQVAGIIAPSGR